MKLQQEIKSFQKIAIVNFCLFVFGIVLTGFWWPKPELHKIADLCITILGIIVLLYLVFQYKKLSQKLELLNNHNLTPKIAQIIPIGVTILDKEGIIKFANEQAEKILGLTKDKILQSKYNETTFQISDLEGNHFPNEKLPFQLVKSSLKPVFNIQHAIKWPGKETVFLSVNAAPVMDEDNNFDGVVASFENITGRKLAEKQFNNLYTRYEAVLSTVVDIIMEVDVNKVYTWANKAGIDFFGKDVIGREASGYFIGNQDVYEKVQPIFNGADNFTYVESWQLRCDGEKRLLAWYCSALKDSSGNVSGALSSARDITELKKIEDSLKENEVRYRTIFNENPIGIVTVTADFRFITANISFSNMLGYSEEELKSLTFKDLTHPDYIIKDINAVKKLRKGEISVYSTEKIYIKKDKSLVWALTTVTTINDAAGEFLYFLAMTEDITESKSRLTALQESEARFRTIIETTNEWIWELNPEGRHVYSNPAIEAILGYRPDEITDKDSSEFIYEEDLLGISEFLTSHIGEKKGWRNQVFRWKHKNGTIRYLESNAIPLLSTSGELSGFRGADRDITERKIAEFELIKAKERAEESDRLKSAFLSNMSHEIRTPMNAIIGFSDFLIQPDLSEEKKEQFSFFIKERSYDLLRIIEDILDISKIDAGQMKILPTEISLLELLHELCEYYKLKKDKFEIKSNLVIKINIDERLRKTRIKADRQRLKQVLNNLLDNAFKFTDEGSIEFGCSISSGSEILFFVKDTGIGIPKEKQNIIFDRFRQADESLSARQYGGTGLGLSIVSGIINLMNGRIWLESEVGKGTTFYFSLPLNIQVLYENTDNAPETEKKASLKEKTILIVEDDELNAEYLKILLSYTDSKVMHACSGEKALQLFRENPQINIVLMDIRLPDMNGLDLTRSMKKENPQLIVIAQTAYAGSAVVKDCLEAGCNDYISKPINKNKLFSLIDKNILSLNREDC